MNRLLFVNLEKTDAIGYFRVITWRAYVSVHGTFNWMRIKTSSVTYDYFSAGRAVEELARELKCARSLSTNTFPTLSSDDLELRAQLTLRDANEQVKLR